MSDLIKRLRTAEKNYVRPHDVESLYNEAADRIEKLETRVKVKNARLVTARDRIEELEARMERIADRAESLGEAQWIAHNSLAALKDQT